SPVGRTRSGAVAGPGSPAVGPPRRMLGARAVHVGEGLAKRPIGQLAPEPAAMTAGAAGVRAQCEALDQEGILDLLKLDRRIAHIALADRHRGGLAILARPPAPAAAENVHQQETPAIGSEAR